MATDFVTSTPGLLNFLDEPSRICPVVERLASNKITPPASTSRTEKHIFFKPIPSVDIMLMDYLLEEIVVATKAWDRDADSGRGGPLHS